MNLGKKIWIWLTIIAIVIISGVTVMHLVINLSTSTDEDTQTTLPSKTLFDTPDCIELTLQGKKVTLFPGNDSFDRILAFNRSRGKQQDYYYSSEYVLDFSPTSKEIILTYCYGENVEFKIPLRTMDALIQGRNISFILTGDYNNAFIVNEQPSMFYTTLNSSTELIDLAKLLLEDTAENASPRSPIFNVPSKILLKLSDKIVTLTPDDEGYNAIIVANSLRMFASFYSPISEVPYDFTDEKYDDLTIIYCYDNAQAKTTIPLLEGVTSYQPEQIIFSGSSARPDIFVLKTSEEYKVFTGLTFNYDLMKAAQKYFFDLP